MRYEKRRQHTLDFKIEAVRRSVMTPGTLSEGARELGVHPNLLCRWRQQLGRYGRIGSQPVKQDQSEAPQKSNAQLKRENEKLRREVERLKMEAEILKKAEAYFTKNRQ